MAWTDLMDLDALGPKGKAVVRRAGRQILVMQTGEGLRACANRCPHQGYPLSEGVLGADCVLTCNWHNWKFDLTTGKALGGRDRLRVFPVRVAEGRVWIDLKPEDPAERRARALNGLREALEREDQERIVREAARLMRLPGDPARAVAEALTWAAERLEFGTTHAVAGAPDWLALMDRRDLKPVERLAALGEVLGHIADDAHFGGRSPFAPGERPWDEKAFLRAVETEDEAAAVGFIRGALSEGRAARDLLPALATAALSHYADFGHSLIYALKTVALIERLGAHTSQMLLSLLARSLVYATREDLLPEFRDYAAQLDDWGGAAKSTPPLAASSLRRLSARRAMQAVRAWGSRHPPEAIFEVLAEAAAWSLLHADEAQFVRAQGKLADNVTWLAFTHPLTFADAAVTAARLRPELWPAILLQLACFIGRNSAYVDAALHVSPFAVDDPAAYRDAATRRLFDHGHDRFIISVHYVKTLAAANALAGLFPEAAPTLNAAMNRFLNAPFKRRHVLRTARQMMDFVAQE
ncbi:MAG: Rieske (2Fe-2S) protein [Caulobacterales bacterium]